MNTMTYKGYAALVEYDDRDRILVAKVIGVRDAITFEADSVEQLQHEFHVSVDDYLSLCAERGISPEKPVSGHMMLRVPPEVHAASLVAARANGESLDQWAVRALEHTAHA